MALDRVWHSSIDLSRYRNDYLYKGCVGYVMMAIALPSTDILQQYVMDDEVTGKERMVE